MTHTNLITENTDFMTGDIISVFRMEENFKEKGENY